MGKDHKIVFNLSLKDLKELGIIKSKRKKRKSRKKRRIDGVYANQTRTQPNFNGYAFTNQTSVNADTDRLKNELAQLQIQQAKDNPLMIENQNQLPQKENPKLLQIQDDLNKFRDSHNRLNNAAGYVYNEYKDRFDKIENKLNGLSSIPSQTINKKNLGDPNDTFDVIPTPGSKDFKEAYGVSLAHLQNDEQTEKQKDEYPETPANLPSLKTVFADFDTMMKTPASKKLDYEDTNDEDTNDEEDNTSDYEEITFKPKKGSGAGAGQPIVEEPITDIVDKRQLTEARRQYTNITNRMGIKVDANIYNSNNADLIRKTVINLKEIKTQLPTQPKVTKLRSGKSYQKKK